MANKDKVRYKYEITQFEKFGYYFKYEDGINVKFESAPKNKLKKLSTYLFERKSEKKSLDSKNKDNNIINTVVIKTYKGKTQYRKKEDEQYQEAK